MSSKAESGERDCESGVPGQQSRCSLCRERLRDAHSHPGQWKSEVQQFLLKYTEITVSSCVCKSCERSLRRGMSGKFKGEFIPRWIKHELKKEKQCCCVPGCGNMSERSCVFAFDMICEAANVSVSEDEAANASGPFHLCSQHYYATYSHCRSVSECALCGSKSQHRAGSDKRLPLRHIPQPESIQIILDDFEKRLDTESVVCNSCYLFCKKLLQQYGEEARSTESIIQSLAAKVGDLKERVHQCRTSGEHEQIALLQTVIFQKTPGRVHFGYTSCIVHVTLTGQCRSCRATQEVH